ncbi:MAG: CPBP family intramembrane metalloprotease [Synechococcales cyanobacterium T60_A2020_003]|nr:CPBP family intramembrane metalloprotease [Synechococcales cyanobacterium T60_A2020_003]
MFLMLMAIAWLPIAGLLLLTIPNANTANIVAMVVLFFGFLGWVNLWGQRVHHTSRSFQRYGLVWNGRGIQVTLLGLAIGIVSLSLLVVVESWLGWLTLDFSVLPGGVVASGLLVGLGVGFAEELFFRGWLLDELQRDYSAAKCLWVNSIIFAVLHFLKPLSEVIRTAPAFPGLVLLGITLVWVKWVSSAWDPRSPNGYLGFPVGLHAVLVWTSYMLYVGNVVKMRDAVPTWITGIDNNPLAGLMGFSFLAVLAWFIRGRSHPPKRLPQSAP